jgi:hypothetical protein
MKIGSTHSYIDGVTLVAVPAGEFTMGSDGKDNPKHTVTLHDYWIYSTEVTNQQYALCVNQGKCAPPNPDDNPGYSNYQLANEPVSGVTYEQAASYCGFVNGRLPSEAEWEKAAQSQQGGPYPWGSADPSCDLLNYNNCIKGKASVVNYKEGVSMYGALNMSGNVYEWIADWYDAEYYASSPAENPTGPASGTVRSVRSSGFASKDDQIALAIRSSESPANHRSDVGFRCVVDDPDYFAPFCVSPLVYATSNAQETGSPETCPVLAIEPVQVCNGSSPQANLTISAPTGAQIDAQDCKQFGSDPIRYSCTSEGKVVSISAACQLNKTGEPSCPAGYSKKDNICVVNADAGQTARHCLAGDYNSTEQCCSLPKEQTDSATILKTCPVGSFYAGRANACLPQPVQEIVTVSLAVTLPSSCTTTASGGNRKGNGSSASNPAGGSSAPTGGCTATAAEINKCNAQAPFYSWNKATCQCEAQ